MQKEQFTISKVFNTTAQRLYTDYLSSEGHASMTGGEAEISNEVGEGFTAWDGYITGRNLELIPNKQIVQSWRTSEFSEDLEDSKLVIDLEDQENGTCVLTLTHSNLQPGDGDKYKDGWQQYYFEPMIEYY